MEENDAYEEWTKDDAESELEHAVALRKKLRVWYWLGGVGAAILVAILIIYAVFGGDSTVITTGDAIATYVLEDGTKVWLDRNSTLDFREFSLTRRVATLRGRAYFEVEHDSDHTFRIFAGGAKVVVVGTSFVVEASDVSPVNTVSVIEGKVRMLGNDASKGLVLRTGDRGVLNLSSRKLTTEKGDIRNMLAWRDRKLVFNKTPLEDVIHTLHDYFGTEVRVSKSSLLRCRFTGSFNNPELKDVLQTVTTSLGLTATKESDAYVLEGNACKP